MCDPNTSSHTQGLYSLSGRTSYRKISWSLEVARLDYNDSIALKFDRHLSSAAADVPVKYQSDWKSLNPNLSVSSLREILRWDVRPLSE